MGVYVQKIADRMDEKRGGGSVKPDALEGTVYIHRIDGHLNGRGLSLILHTADGSIRIERN